jgi:hypothetical protein
MAHGTDLAVTAKMAATGHEEDPKLIKRCREGQKGRGETGGRGERIRTSDSCVPNAVLYQAELRPDRGDNCANNF